MKLSMSGVSKCFGSTKVFQDIELTVDGISSLILIGPSGGGKTTLLRLLGGLERPDSGRVEVNGRSILYQEDALREYRKRMGFVFQNYNLFPHLTALENIVLPLVKIHGEEPAHAKDHALSLLQRFHLEEHAYKRPHMLSGGQQQRVAICRAVSAKPEILFFDEPTSALDPEYTAEVLDLIQEVHNEGTPTVVVTHEMGFARIAAEQVLFIGYGGIAAQGSPEEIFQGHEDPRIDRFFEKVLKY